jgi:hypothetical protein
MANKKLSKHVPDIKAALDKAFAEHLGVTQGKLEKANPADTGRMASSWYIGKDQPDRSVRPEDWAPPGAQRRESPKYNGRIEYDGTWYLSNNLPYSERVAYDPKWAAGGGGGAAWFTTITGQMTADLNKRMERYLPK